MSGIFSECFTLWMMGMNDLFLPSDTLFADQAFCLTSVKRERWETHADKIIDSLMVGRGNICSNYWKGFAPNPQQKNSQDMSSEWLSPPIGVWLSPLSKIKRTEMERSVMRLMTNHWNILGFFHLLLFFHLYGQMCHNRIINGLEVLRSNRLFRG